MELLRAIHMNQKTSHMEYLELVDKYNESIYKFCRSLTYSKEDAEDLFQETFLKAFEEMEKIDHSDNPQSFLFSITLYTWKSWKRKYARRKRLAPDEPISDSIPSTFNLEDTILAQEEIRIVQQLVGSLSEKFRLPIIMYYSLDMSISDIAPILKLPEGTIKSRLFKARKLIEKGLVEIEYEK